MLLFAWILESVVANGLVQVVPAVNQVELHPCNPSPKLIAYCKEKGIHCSGYSPLGSTDSPLSKSEKLQEVAKAHGKSPQQVLLAWGVQKGWSVLPKSVTKSRIVSNFELDDFELSQEDIKKIDSIQERFKVCGDAWLPNVKVFFGDDE
jgi:glycerol 2-dehydrogenase (NADP+)